MFVLVTYENIQYFIFLFIKIYNAMLKIRVNMPRILHSYSTIISNFN